MVCISGGSSKNRMVSIGTSLVDPIPTVMTVTLYYCFSFCFTYTVSVTNNSNIENEKQTHLSFFLFFVSSFELRFWLSFIQCVQVPASTTASSDLQPAKIFIVLFQFSKSDAVLDNDLFCILYKIYYNFQFPWHC